MTVNGLSILRSLAGHGVTTYGLDRDPSRIGFFSRSCRHRILVPDPASSPQGFLAGLRAAASRSGSRPVLFIASDDYLAFFARHRAEADELFVHDLPSAETLDTILDKRKLAAAAAKASLAHPRTFWPSHPGEVRDMAGTLRYPVVLKPALGHVARRQDLFRRDKLLVIESAAGLVDGFARVLAAGVDVLVQELVPGPDHEIYLCYACYSREGRPLSVFTKRKLRQFPIHAGYGCANESVREPEAARLGQAFLESLSFRGLGGVEFKRDERDGRLKMIEVHGRTPMTGGIAVASGLDLPWIAYRDMTGEPVEPCSDFREGVRWFRVRHDWAALRMYRREGSLGIRSWIRSYRRPRVFSTFSPSDPFILLKRFAWEALGPLRRFVRTAFFR